MTAAVELVSRAEASWRDEIDTLTRTASELPPAARLALERVLEALVHDPETDAATARDIRRAVAALSRH